MTDTKDNLLSVREVCKRVGRCKRTLDSMEAKGKFPRRIRLGEGQYARAMWFESEINAWLEALKISRPPTHEQLAARAIAPRRTDRARVSAYQATPLDEQALARVRRRMRQNAA